MRRAVSMCMASCCLAALASTGTAAVSEHARIPLASTAVDADCSKAAALEVVTRLRLNDPEVPNPIFKVLCGSFTGPGSQTMVVSLSGPGNTGMIDCCPSGGKKARLWHWDGARLVAGPWKQVQTGVASSVRRSTSTRPAGTSPARSGADNDRTSTARSISRPGTSPWTSKGASRPAAGPAASATTARGTSRRPRCSATAGRSPPGRSAASLSAPG